MSQTSCCQCLKFCCSRQLGWMFVCCPQFSPGALPHGAAGCDGLGLDRHLAVSVQLDLCGGHLRPHLHPQMLERVREGILRNAVSVILVVVFFLTGLSLSVFTSPCLTSVWSIFPEVRLNGQYMSSKCPKMSLCYLLVHFSVTKRWRWTWLDTFWCDLWAEVPAASRPEEEESGEVRDGRHDRGAAHLHRVVPAALHVSRQVCGWSREPPAGCFLRDHAGWLSGASAAFFINTPEPNQVLQ